MEQCMTKAQTQNVKAKYRFGMCCDRIILKFWCLNTVLYLPLFKLFFAQSEHVKLDSPQAARLSIFFITGKSIVKVP